MNRLNPEPLYAETAPSAGMMPDMAVSGSVVG